MNNWTKIVGLEANRLAEEWGIARPGTYNSIILKWVGDGSPPVFPMIRGTVKCVSCAKVAPFTVETMEAQSRCGDCGTTFRLYRDQHCIGESPGMIVLASVFSRAAAGAAYPPQVDVIEVASGYS